MNELQLQCQAQAAQLEKALLTVQEEKDLVREVWMDVNSPSLPYSMVLRHTCVHMYQRENTSRPGFKALVNAAPQNVANFLFSSLGPTKCHSDGVIDYFYLQVQRELRQHQEQSAVTLRTQQEEAAHVQSELQQQLHACQQEIRELEGLRTQMASKEEVEERLVRENEDLASRLSIAEHQLAVSSLRSKGSREGAGEGEGEEGQEVEAMKEMQRRTVELNAQ